jgi:hypothetical protein
MAAGRDCQRPDHLPCTFEYAKSLKDITCLLPGKSGIMDMNNPDAELIFLMVFAEAKGEYTT